MPPTVVDGWRCWRLGGEMPARRLTNTAIHAGNRWCHVTNQIRTRNDAHGNHVIGSTTFARRLGLTILLLAALTVGQVGVLPALVEAAAAGTVVAWGNYTYGRRMCPPA